jgi:hypothetical protein
MDHPRRSAVPDSERATKAVVVAVYVLLASLTLIVPALRYAVAREQTPTGRQRTVTVPQLEVRRR